MATAVTITEQRRAQLLELIRQRGFASLNDLATELDVSESTIRRDLDYLEESGSAKRAHGGAFYTGPSPQLAHFRQRQSEQWERKQQIAATAVFTKWATISSILIPFNLLLAYALAFQWRRGWIRRTMLLSLLVVGAAILATFAVWAQCKGFASVAPNFAAHIPYEPVHRWYFAAMFKTLRTKIADMKDDLLVLPGHYLEWSEANAEKVFADTLGNIKSKNSDIYGIEDENDFVRFIQENMRQQPDVYGEIRKVNAGILVVDDEEQEIMDLGKNECAASMHGK